MKRVLLASVLASSLHGAPPFFDRTYPSQVLAEERHYRIFLPPGYTASAARYPVIYYFHGHSDRYTLEAYDRGLDTVPKIAAFVAGHPVIVVAPDGYVARHYTAFYQGDPYDLRRDGGDLDFGAAFEEFAHFVDAHYRTLSSRRFRATSGLSMGGFMSLYLSARFPDLIGSASAFNPGPEFYVGEKGRRSLWRPKDHVLDHAHTMVRLIRASGDYISQYHEETRAGYASSPTVPFEFRQDEYHRHWATSIPETFDFHMRAFASPALDASPGVWNYSSAFASFETHAYRVQTNLSAEALIYLDHVTPGEIGLRTRRWSPDGPPAPCSSLSVETAPLYRPSAGYQIFDLNTASGRTADYEAVADAAGRLHLSSDCAGHEIGINGPGVPPPPLVFLALTGKDALRLPPGKAVRLPVRIFNPGGAARRGIKVELRSAYPTIEVVRGDSRTDALAPGAVADLAEFFEIRATAGEGDFERARLSFTINSEKSSPAQHDVDIFVAPENIPAPAELAVLDGRTITFPVFRQRGNAGGGSSVQRTVTEGRGNGNGVLEPGEQATFWVKVRQGLDPFDKNNWRRAKIYSDSPWLAEVADLEEQKQLEWTSAQNRTSIVELSAATPAKTAVPMILDCEAWSFHFTPDVRYGSEPLYQAFQIHHHQLFTWTWSRP